MRRSAFQEINKWRSFLNRLTKEERKIEYLIYRLKWNILPKIHFYLRFPTHIDIETTNKCNLRCVMCPHSFPTEEFKKSLTSLDGNIVYKIIDEGAEKGLNSIKMFFRGEPLVDKRIVDFIKYAKERGITEISINTNGQLLSEELSYRLIKSGLDMIVIAMDGNSRATYNKIRVGGDFNKLVQDVESLLELKRKMKSEKPIVRLQFLKVDTNKHEIEDFIKRWDNRVDSLSIKDYTNRGEAQQRLTDNNYIKYSRLPCPQLWQRVTITCNRKVLMCCRDWNCENVIGKIDYENGNTLEKIWKSDMLNNIRQIHLNRQLETIDLCKKCTYKESFDWGKM